MLSADTYKLWFAPLRACSLEGNNIVLEVANDFCEVWLKDNYLGLLQDVLAVAAGRPLQVKFKVSTANPVNTTLAKDFLAKPKPAEPVHERNFTNNEWNFNPKNTFDTFVVGNNNNFAYAAALAVAQAPGKSYNPLFLYGGVGLGKTHLLHAIGQHVSGNKKGARVAYLSSEKFTNEYIDGIQNNQLAKFRKKYRQTDVLLIDDIQFLAGKERIQEEFFHTFNDLFESGRQIILSSDRPITEIATLESRLVSRFQWGLAADIQSPDFETRLAILRSKAAALKIEIPMPVLEFMAQHIVKNIRRLEGALIKISSYSALTGKPLDLPTTESLLKDVLMEEAQNRLNIEGIQKRVADHFQIRHSDMTSKRRPNAIAFPRQIAMYLSRQLTRHSLQEIGEAFGGRDHGTVIHAIKTVENLMETDESVRGSVDFLKTQLSK